MPIRRGSCIIQHLSTNNSPLDIRYHPSLCGGLYNEEQMAGLVGTKRSVFVLIDRGRVGNNIAGHNDADEDNGK